MQLEGLLLALYALLAAVKGKGLLTEREIDEALVNAEANALADAQRVTQLSAASLDGMIFPIRFFASREHGVQSAGNLYHYHPVCRRNETAALGVTSKVPRKRRSS